MRTPSARLGVDIGGTFTDVVLEAGADQFSAKVLTTYAAPEDAIIDGVKQVAAKAGIDPGNRHGRDRRRRWLARPCRCPSPDPGRA